MAVNHKEVTLGRQRDTTLSRLKLPRIIELNENTGDFRPKIIAQG